ncbi:metaxin-3 isoform X2 [Protopterus annectens]|uniref:metaxin-3 isoform X2 n=1 Tax=Protopterus annectens TaxID=7888 RepID=UPI001CFA7BC8|nr:metaxin-3 isoform X2 [Protopterus annectens]
MSLGSCRMLHIRCYWSHAYIRFTGAPVKLNHVDNTWKTSTGFVPAMAFQEVIFTRPSGIINLLRKQKYNADYFLSAKEGADTLAYVALLEEKLYPALLYTFWVDSENYCNMTRPWFAARIPFPLNFYLPGKMARAALRRILLTRGAPPLYNLSEVEMQINKDAKECLNLLSYRLGMQQFFFGDIPTSLDAFVFGYIAPLYKACLHNSHLQLHLKQLHNLCKFCDSILSTYFTSEIQQKLEGLSPAMQDTVDANLQKLTQLVNKESNLIEKMDDKLRQSPQHRPIQTAVPKPAAVSDQSNSTQFDMS